MIINKKRCSDNLSLGSTNFKMDLPTMMTENDLGGLLVGDGNRVIAFDLNNLDSHDYTLEGRVISLVFHNSLWIGLSNPNGIRRLDTGFEPRDQPVRSLVRIGSKIYNINEEGIFNAETSERVTSREFLTSREFGNLVGAFQSGIDAYILGHKKDDNFNIYKLEIDPTGEAKMTFVRKYKKRSYDVCAADVFGNFQVPGEDKLEFRKEILIGDAKFIYGKTGKIYPSRINGCYCSMVYDPSHNRLFARYIENTHGKIKVFDVISNKKCVYLKDQGELMEGLSEIPGPILIATNDQLGYIKKMRVCNEKS